MSALTKIFVVLLVVLSLLLSAGLIVFVNRQDNYKAFAETAKKQLAAALSEKTLATSQLEKLQGEKQDALTEKDNQINGLKATIANDERSVADKTTQIAELQQQVTQANAANSSLAEGLKVAQQDIASRQTAYAALQTDSDKHEKELVEDSNRISDLTNSLDVATKQYRYLAEQNTKLATDNDSLNATLRKYNISPSGNTLPAGGAINNTPNVNINGIVRDFRTINGVPYATISLGSADAVTRGMQFKVIDPQHNTFLGYLTIENVRAHEADGRLEGPAVSQVRPNISEVRTQL